MQDAHRHTLGVLAALALVLGGVLWGGHPDALPGFLRDTLTSRPSSRVLSEALDRIEQDYYRPVDRAKLQDTSLRALVGSLHDRFSAYFTPRQYRDFTERSNEQFSGVGMDVQPARRGLFVTRVFDESPAQRAGIRAHDLVIAVDGHPLAGVALNRATSLIKGRPGTDVGLTVLHAGGRRTLRITRAEVSVPVVASALRGAGTNRVAVVALSDFSTGAHTEVREAIAQLQRRGARAVVLDLRGNGGGLVDEARLVASIFIRSGPIVSTRGRTRSATTMDATGDAIADRIALAVLVDHGTASAAEIVAGALQDRHRATIVGSRTFGKGVFQEVQPLSNGGALDITVGEYYLPSGRNLGAGGIRLGAGITPDVVVRQAPSRGADPALAAALRLLAAKRR